MKNVFMGEVGLELEVARQMEGFDVTGPAMHQWTGQWEKVILGDRLVEKQKISRHKMWPCTLLWNHLTFYNQRLPFKRGYMFYCWTAQEISDTISDVKLYLLSIVSFLVMIQGNIKSVSHVQSQNLHSVRGQNLSSSNASKSHTDCLKKKISHRAFIYLFIHLLHHAAGRILVPRTGIETVSCSGRAAGSPGKSLDFSYRQTYDGLSSNWWEKHSIILDCLAGDQGSKSKSSPYPLQLRSVSSDSKISSPQLHFPSLVHFLSHSLYSLLVSNLCWLSCLWSSNPQSRLSSTPFSSSEIPLTI